MPLCRDTVTMLGDAIKCSLEGDFCVDSDCLCGRSFCPRAWLYRSRCSPLLSVPVWERWGATMDSEPLWLTRAWSRAGASARIGLLVMCSLLFALVADSRPVLAYAADRKSVV